MDSPKPRTTLNSSPKADDLKALTIYTPTTALAAVPVGEMVISYRECLKNHAASFGGHALDGCGEFMPSPAASPADPISLKCAACGCHRNFHRRDLCNDHRLYSPVPSSSDPPSSPSPPAQSISSPMPCSYYTSTPHVLLSLSTGLPGLFGHENNHQNQPGLDPTAVMKIESSTRGTNVKKRSRTRFTQGQKVKMRAFAEQLGWKMNGCDEKLVRDFCTEVGVDRSVLKVWIHNNKYSANSKKVTMNRLCLENTGFDDNGGHHGNGSSANVCKVE